MTCSSSCSPTFPPGTDAPLGKATAAGRRSGIAVPQKHEDTGPTHSYAWHVQGPIVSEFHPMVGPRCAAVPCALSCWHPQA